jgi:hypothetical protein
MKAWPTVGHSRILPAERGRQGSCVTITSDDDIMACRLLTNQSLRKLCIIIMQLFSSVLLFNCKWVNSEAWRLDSIFVINSIQLTWFQPQWPGTCYYQVFSILTPEPSNNFFRYAYIFALTLFPRQVVDIVTKWSRPGRALPPGKEPPVPTVQEAGWAPEAVWTQMVEKKSSASVGDRTPAVLSAVRHYTEWVTPALDIVTKTTLKANTALYFLFDAACYRQRTNHPYILLRFVHHGLKTGPAIVSWTCPPFFCIGWHSTQIYIGFGVNSSSWYCSNQTVLE